MQHTAQLLSEQLASSALRRVLQASGFTASAAEKLWKQMMGDSPAGSSVLTGSEFSRLRHSLDRMRGAWAEGSAQAEDTAGGCYMCIALWLVGVHLPAVEVAKVLGQSSFDLLVSTGALVQSPSDPSHVFSPVQVYPLRLLSAWCGTAGPDAARKEVWIAADWEWDGAGLPVGLHSLELALAAPALRHGVRLLDVCSGSGVQATPPTQ